MKTRIALVLGGTGSLGAYSAGAATELLRALEENPRGGDVSLSVVVGRDAGALTAALAARSLVVNPSLTPWIGRCWVEALGADQLLPPDGGGAGSLLDTGPLRELTGHLVAGDPAADDRPGAALDGALLLGLVSSAEPGGPVEAPFELTAAHAAGDPVWGRIREAAHRALLPAPLTAGDGTGRGGPDGTGGEGALRLADRLVRRAPAEASDRWQMVVVDPAGGRRPDGPRDEGPDSGAGVSGGGPVSRLLRAALGTDPSLDLGELEDAAERLETLRALAARLPEIHGRLEDPDAVQLGRRIGEMAEQIAEREVRRSGGAGEGPGDPVLLLLDEHLTRIQEHPAYAASFRDVSTRAGRTRLAKLIYVLEAIGGLEGREPYAVHRISPDDPGTLAGGGFGGFGGFLHRGWRRHDFVSGRRDARDLLRGGLADVVAYEPEAPEAYEPPAVSRDLRRMSRTERRRIRSRLEDAADRVLDGVRPGGMSGLLYRLARPGMRRSLAERMEAAL